MITSLSVYFELGSVNCVCSGNPFYFLKKKNEKIEADSRK